MELALILLQQLVTMLLFLALGFVLYRKGVVTPAGSKDIAGILVYAVMPCMILNSFITGYTAERMQHLLVAFILSFAALAFSIFISWVVLHKKRIDYFAASYSNAGYMGIPLVGAVLGSEAVFYVTAFIAMLNLLQWTHGVFSLTGKKDSIQPKKILTNPLILSVFIGILLFVTQLPVPALVHDALGAVATMNGPIAMMILGFYLAQTKIASIFTDIRLYPATLLRLVVIPLLTLLWLALVPNTYWLVKMVVLIVASAPIGTNVAILAHIYGEDYTRAVRSVCLSTLLSVLSMPCIVALAQVVFKQ